MSTLKGQPTVVDALRRATQQKRLGHGLLFLGPSGVGRELAARLLARGLLCTADDHEAHLPFGCGTCSSCTRVMSGNHPDVHWVMSEAEQAKRADGKGPDRPSADLKVEQVRQLVREMRMRPYEGRARVAIVVDAHRMNESASNAFLKTLEEPGDASVLILTAPHVRAVLPTIASRCQRLVFRPLPQDAVAALLQARGVERADERAALAEGSMERALQVDLEEDQGRDAQIEELLEELLQGNVTERLDVIERLGRDRQELSQLLSAWEDLLGRTLRRHARGEDVSFLAPLHPRSARLAQREIANTKDAIGKNAHAQLAMEELFLQALSPRVLGRAQ